MCWKCSICDAVSAPGRPRKTWPLKRADGTIASEPAVCDDCLSCLMMLGMSWSEVVRQRGKPQRMVALPSPAEPEPAALVPLPYRRVAVKPPNITIAQLRAKQSPI